MAMTILNNTAAQMTLGELNKNISRVGKDLKKISKGERVAGAGDGASDYAISEKMRVQMRALDQDVRNTQNGASMLKVAEGGMQEIVDNLRSIRELAINAANDHNTDDDRRILQKDIDQRRENINEIAATTSYNGRLLLMGDYSTNIKVGKELYETQYETIREHVAVQVGTTEKQVTITTPSVTYIPGTTGKPGILIQNNHVDGFTKSLTPAYNSCKVVPNAVAQYNSTPCQIGFNGNSYSYYNGKYHYFESFNPYQSSAQTLQVTMSPQQVVLNNYVKALIEYDGTGDRVDYAVSTATNGKFTTFDELKTSFDNDLASVGLNSIFLKDYCDIDLGNTDNGAITGSDANPGNSIISAEDAVDEEDYSDTSTWKMPTLGATSQTSGGITVTWPSSDAEGNPLTSDAEFIMKGLNTVWLDKAWERIQKTYPGLFDNTSPVRNLTLEFNGSTGYGYGTITDGSGNITGYKMFIGTEMVENMDTNNPNGYSPTKGLSSMSKYLDNHVAMMMTSMVFQSAIKNYNDVDDLGYGLQYAVTGHDDSITVSSSDFRSTYDEEYALMRYMAKQGSDGIDPEIVNITINDGYTDGGSDWSSDGHMAVNVKFDQLTKDGSPASVSDLDQQGFTIACSGCDQFINIKFDTSTTQSSFVREGNNDLLSTYTIGIADLTDISKLGKAIFEGISSIGIEERDHDYDVKDIKNSSTNKTVSVVIDGYHDLRMVQDPNNSDNYLFTKTKSPTMGFIEGTVIEEPIDASGEFTPGETIVTEENITKTITVPVYEYHEEDVELPIGEKLKTIYENVGNPLYIHTGPKQNINIAVNINDMRTDAMGFTDDVGVQTRQKASDSLEKIDDAIQYALDEITRVGSIRNRLEYTEANLVTAAENTQSSESVIRDADMAKEMASFTKNNVLAQAAQSMLAQANQNSSSVLGLLQ